MPAHSMLGKRLGNYVLRDVLGEGGMGTVFAAEHLFLGTGAAIKVLHGSFANNESVTQRFFQEAKSTLQIDHPNIIKIIDFGQSTDGELYLAMELLYGQSLSTAIAAGPLDEPTAARIATVLADALAVAHHKGIVHRDLKPDNVFLTTEGDVKLLDFGIAKVAASGSGTKTGSLLGTPLYMAPEQARGSKVVGPHTDIYALGAILFAMVTGRPPFLGDEVAQLLGQHLFEAPPRPSELHPVSPVLEELILECLRKEPAERPASMLAVRERLAPLVPEGHLPQLRATAGMAAALRTPTPTPPPVAAAPSLAAAPPVAATSTISEAASEMVPRARRSPPPVVVGVAVAAVALVVGVVAWRAGTHPAAPASRPAAPAPVVAAPAAAPAPAPRVELRLKLTPPDALVTLDGVSTTANPIRLSPSDMLHTIEVSAPGFVTVRRELRAEMSGDVVIVCEREKKAVARPRPKAAAPKRKISGPVENDL